MTPVTAANTRLLIVDDIEDNRRLLSRRFARRGFKSIEADSGPTALDLIAQHTFDLVLLDIMMPGIDGIEVLRRIRAKHSPESLPVIMVTAKAFSKDIIDAIELGANDYIIKPVDFSVAFLRVQIQLARKQARQALNPIPHRQIVLLD
jgi:DNA-binding response OmpR family regulator